MRTANCPPRLCRCQHLTCCQLLPEQPPLRVGSYRPFCCVFFQIWKSKAENKVEKRKPPEIYLVLSDLLMFPSFSAHFLVNCSNILSLQVLGHGWQPGATRVASVYHLLDSSYFPGVFPHQIEAFQIEAVSLGNLQRVLLRCEASDTSQGLYCEKIVVKEAGTASESIFTCER